MLFSSDICWPRCFFDSSHFLVCWVQSCMLHPVGVPGTLLTKSLVSTNFIMPETCLFEGHQTVSRMTR